ncbi:MAG: glycosyltransferase [Deltaproteobacteria bacterium]|jgi:UDP-N-acetylglucosamine transferase subunit ALG13
MTHIFVTVGAQMPFDRMVHAVDAWAAARGRAAEVLAQIGASEAPPPHVAHVRFLDPPAFDRAYAEASLVVAHAGTGSILAALERGKPIVVVPRRASLRETRNDHQIATARAFERAGRVLVAWDETEVAAVLDRAGDAPRPAEVGPHASPELVAAIRSFLES